MSSSAFLGQPPADQDDFYIIKGMYRAAYAFNKDPSKGYLFVPRKPENYGYNDKQASIIVGMALAIIIMMFTTALRLTLRRFKTGVRWGADDWILIPAAVWLSSCHLSISVNANWGADHGHVVPNTADSNGRAWRRR